MDINAKKKNLLILFTFLSPPNTYISLFVCNLSPLWSPSLPLLPISFSLSFFFFISNSLPLSSSLYSADFKPLSCCRSRLEQPPADLVLTLLRHTSPISLSLSLDVWLFWLLVVGWFWLMVVGWSGCGCVIWDGFKILDDLRSGCGCDICGCGWVSLALSPILVVVVYVVVFFFFCSSGWYWWSMVDLWRWLVVVSYGNLSMGVSCCYCCCWWR